MRQVKPVGGIGDVADGLVLAFEELAEEERAQAEAKAREKEARARERSKPRRGRSRQSIGEAMLKSAARSVGRSLGSKLVRGLLGSLLK